MTEQLASFVWLPKLFEKLKHLSKECDVSFEPIKKQQSVEQIASGFISIVEEIIKYVIDLRTIEEQYIKLEGVLQKYESDIRKHIGVEQQLRLYGESLQSQLEQSEGIRFDFLEKTRIIISDLKRNNQKLHEQNMQLKQRIEDARNVVGSQHRLEIRSRVNTQQTSKQRISRAKLITVDSDMKRHNRSDSKDHAKTPTKPTEYSIKLDGSKKDLGRNLIPSFHTDRKKDIQKKIRQLVENRNPKKAMFQHNSYNQQINSKTVAHTAARRSLRKSIESRDSHMRSMNEDVIKEEMMD